MGRPDDGRWGLGEERPRRHCIVRHSPYAETRWLEERKLAIVGKSHDAHAAAFPTTSGVGPWKVQNRRVDHP